MEADFWQDKWVNNLIGFHQTDYHPWLDLIAKHKNNAHLFVPLCGKSLDMWPLAQRYDKLAAAELSEIAFVDFFKEAKLQPQVYSKGLYNRYSLQRSPFDISIWQGDYFGLTNQQLAIGQQVDIFDRAAMIALPALMRDDYVSQLKTLFKHATLFLLTLEFDQQELSGPPFSIDETVIEQSFSFADSIELLATSELSDKIFAQRKLKVSHLVESLYLIKW